MTTPEPEGGESMEDVADRLESIRERVEAATEGPWKLWNGWGPLERDGLHRVGRIGPASGGGVERPHHHDVSPDTHPRDITAPKEDLEFVAAARSDVPYLLSLVERVGEALAAISDQTWSHVEYDLGPRSDTTMMLLDALRDAAQEGAE